MIMIIIVMIMIMIIMISSFQKMMIIHKQLQNLAKIASRYSSLNKDKARAQDFTSPNAKKVN